MSNIGQKIKQLREFNNYTQEYMAEQLAMTTAGYSRIEREEVGLNVDKLQKIASILKVEPSAFLETEKTMTNYVKGERCYVGQNYLSDKQDLYNSIIEQLKSENQHLKEEITFLRQLIK